MRRSTLLLALLALACGGGERDLYSVITDFADRATAAACVPGSLGDSVAVTEIRAVTDSTWLLLDEPRRRIAELDHRLRPLWSMEYPGIGPAAVVKAVSAGLLGDTAVAILDRGRLRLQILSRAGDPIRSTPLGFLPNRLATTAAGEVLVTPLRVGNEPPTLLIRFAGDARREVPVPPRYYEDVMVRAMGNIARVETWPDGRAVVVHEYLSPRGFVVGRGGEVRQFAVPTPDATLAQLAYVPTPPFTEEDQPRILVPALGLSVDRAGSELYLMTRSGKRVGDVPQRAILRLDEALRFAEAYTLDVAASGMAVLPRHRVAIVADGEDRLFRCTLSGGGDGAERH